MLLKHVVLIIQIVNIIRDNYKHGRHEAGKANQISILSFNKRKHRQSLNNKFGTHIEKSMVLKQETVYHS